MTRALILLLFLTGCTATPADCVAECAGRDLKLRSFQVLVLPLVDVPLCRCEAGT